MKLNRRQFVKAVIATTFLPAAEVSSSPAFTVDRSNMWTPDTTSEETISRCNKILAVDPNNVLALIHRGQIPAIYTDSKQAWTDLTRAIALEPTNPCCRYIRGVCFDNAEDLQHAASLLSKNGDIGGKAICTSQPDIYEWRGSDDSELLYMAYRELGSVQEESRIDEALVAFERAASFQVISQTDLERWTESDTQVGRICEAVANYRRLIAIQPKASYHRSLEECLRWVRVPRRVWWARHRAD